MTDAVTDDQKLLESINEGGKDKPKKKEKESEVVAEKEEKQQEQKKDDQKRKESAGVLDPTDDFVKMLESVGIKRPKAEIVADIFFRGDINDPAYLDKSLVLADLGVKQRELVITAYYGSTPEELGIELMPQTKARQQAKVAASVGEPSNEDLEGMDLGKVHADMLRSRLRLLTNKQIMNEIRRMDDEDTNRSRPKELPKKVVSRPLISKEGEIVVKDGVPVMERIVYEGDGFSGSNSSSDTIMPILLAKILEKDKTPVIDPNVKPSWAVDMERKIDQQKADEEKRRLEDELKHEKEKREELEKEYKKELDRVAEQHQRDIERLREDTNKQIELQNQRFEDDKKHREELDATAGAYGQKLDEIKKELDLTRKDIKSTVVGEAVKSTSTILKSATQTTEEVIKPIAETATELWKAQVKIMQKNAGIDPTKTIPNTTEEELQALARG